MSAEDNSTTKPICEIKEENGEKPIKDLVVEDEKAVCEGKQVPKEGETPKGQFKLSQEESEKVTVGFQKLQDPGRWLRNLKEFYEQPEKIASLHIKTVPAENHETLPPLRRPFPFLYCGEMIGVRSDDSPRDLIPQRGKFDQPAKAKLVEMVDPPLPPVAPEANPTPTQEVESASLGIDAPVPEFINVSDTTPTVADEQIRLPEETSTLDVNPRPNPTEEEEDDQK